MLSFVRRRLTFANGMVVVMALLVMSGGAYAASKYLITSTKQISPTVLKKLRGAAGPRGAAGATGPQGLQGKEGVAGKNGTNGTAGEKGQPGAPGESVTTTRLAEKNVNCAAGGAEFKVGSGAPAYACNGSVATTLKKGETERGSWGMTITSTKFGGKNVGAAPITFQVPMYSEAAIEHVEYLPEGHTTTNCVGKENGEFQAAEGYLCIYTEEETSGPFTDTDYWPRTGVGYTVLLAGTTSEGIAVGSWAATAE
ncbi:MAG: hypothetical protein WAU69_06390 [Solirubrobacteraceae bacterium]